MTTIRICFVGDSLVLGTNDEAYLGWPGRLCREARAAGHDVSLYNLGIRAETSEQIAPRWRAECAPRIPDVHPGALVFSFGANDCAEIVGQGRRVRALHAADHRAALHKHKGGDDGDAVPFGGGGQGVGLGFDL